MGRDNLCVHPLICQRRAARLRPHRAVTTALGRGLKATGAEIDYERWIPHLYQLDERGAIKAAQLDIAAVWPGAHALMCYDITISCPLKSGLDHTHSNVAVAAMDGERKKQRRYGNEARAISFETFGRLGPRSLLNLAEAAREASVYGRTNFTASQLQRRWRADMELALMYAQADAMLAARGARPTVAGQQYFPVARMLPPATAAGGENTQRDTPEVGLSS